MKILVSPAKSLDFETPSPIKKSSKASFLDYSSEIQNHLKLQSPKQISELMKVSDKIAQLNWTRNQQWELPFDNKNSKQAVFAFTGDVYKGLEASSLSEKNIDYLQENLRILSGLYGLLKPLDMIMPYRLEMGTKIKIGNNDNLYKFWGDLLTDNLISELKDDEAIINLASNEYFKAIVKKKIKTPIITPVFKDTKNGKLKIISFFAKKARGMMVRYIVENNIVNSEDIKGFDSQGYIFSNELSNETEFVFTRNEL